MAKCFQLRRYSGGLCPPPPIETGSCVAPCLDEPRPISLWACAPTGRKPCLHPAPPSMGRPCWTTRARTSLPKSSLKT